MSDLPVGQNSPAWLLDTQVCGWVTTMTLAALCDERDSGWSET